MPKLPTRSPTDEDLPIARLSAMGLELEEIAEDDAITQQALVELAEDRGRPASHYLCAVALATELRVTPSGPVRAKVCAGNCQRWGARDVLDKLVALGVSIDPRDCLDRCDLAPAVELSGPGGDLVVAPAKVAALDEAFVAVGSHASQ
ncbi:MAG TPA: (2Fe-2S) ferredoxin domain-containing protein [Kofleriaceae bacterium]|jgi:NADH:ubiquinone oxidoreductase subunit E